jgi:hypothetical protein
MIPSRSVSISAGTPSFLTLFFFFVPFAAERPLSFRASADRAILRGWLVHAKEYLLENSRLGSALQLEAQKAAQIMNCVPMRVCTYSVTKQEFYPQVCHAKRTAGPSALRLTRVQWYWHCSSCGLTGDLGLCEVCKDLCHNGHDLSRPIFSPKFFCDCGAGKKCQAL